MAWTGSPNSSSVMPAGVTSDGTSWVTVPITATLTPFISSTVYSGRTGSVVPFL
ncbi:hypothetical protein D3C84_1319140 [compost metagenome]